MRRKKKPAVVVDLTRIAVAADDRTRILQLAATARESLRPFVELDANQFGYFVFKSKVVKTYVNKLGGIDGVGLLLKAGALDVDGDGQIDDAELSRFNDEGASLIDSAQAAMLNYLVVYSLLLTMFISLIVLHVGSGAYAGDDAVASGMAVTNGANAFADFASFAWPTDAAAQVRVRQGLYVCEYVCLALGTWRTSHSLFDAIFQYQILSTGLPSTVSKCELLISKPGRLASVATGFGPCIHLLLFGVDFALARASAVAFFCSTCAHLLLFGSVMMQITHEGNLTEFLRAQHREAQLLLLGEPEPQLRASSAPTTAESAN